MARLEKVLLLAAGLGIAAAAIASETITYTYDARGRLVKVERSGTVNNNVKAKYTTTRPTTAPTSTSSRPIAALSAHGDLHVRRGRHAAWRPARARSALRPVARGAGAGASEARRRLINTPAETFAMAPGGVDMRTGRYAYERDRPFDRRRGRRAGADPERSAPTSPGTAIRSAISRTIGTSWSARCGSITTIRSNRRPGLPDLRPLRRPLADLQVARTTNIGLRAGIERRRCAAHLIRATGRAPRSSTPIRRRTARWSCSAPLGTLGSGDCSAERRCAFVSQITEPDGTVLTFDYAASGSGGGTARLRSVTSSRGYALLFEGSGNRVTKACVVNLALAPLPASCAARRNAQATRELRLYAPTRRRPAGRRHRPGQRDRELRLRRTERRPR